MYSVHVEGLLTVAVQVSVGSGFSFTGLYNSDREVKVGAGGRGAVTAKDVDTECVSNPLYPVTVAV